MKREKDITSILQITLVLVSVSWLNGSSLFEAILYGVVFGTAAVILSRITKGVTDKITISFMLAAAAIALFDYAFNDIKKALAITAGLFLLRLSVAVLPGSAYNYLTYAENILRKVKDEAINIMRGEHDGRRD